MMNSFKLKSLLLFSFLLVGKLLFAGDPLIYYFVSDGNNSLYKVNRSTNSVTLIGGTGRNNIEAIAYVPEPGNNRLYATDAGDFGRLDTVSGAFTLIGAVNGAGLANGSEGAVDLTDIDGLMLDGQAWEMWGSHRRTSGPDVLFKIDTTTGRFIPDAFGPGVDYIAIEGGGALDDIDDLAISPVDGKMYATSNVNGQNDVLLTINKYTAQFVFQQTLTEDDMEGLSVHNDGQLWGVEGDDNRMSQINITTGVVGPFIPLLGSDHEAIAALVADANTASGTVFNDADQDGILDGGETGIANVSVFLYVDNNGDGKIDPEDTKVQTRTTDANGNYTFYYASFGNLLISTDNSTYPAGFALTTDNIETATFTDSTNFGETDANNRFGLSTSPDCDGDGIPNFYEAGLDSDGDGVLDSCDLDSDNDGILDAIEWTGDFDDDGIPNYRDRDSDDDGIPDAIEANRGQEPTGYDASEGNISGAVGSNGVVDAIETAAESGVSILPNPDSDGDGNKDYLDLDSDNDGILDLVEVGGVDTDQDGQVDGVLDADGDGYEDNLANDPLIIYNTDSTYEIAQGHTVLPNYLDLDSDNDGIDDTREGFSTADYTYPSNDYDSDGDGILDNYDISTFEEPITPNDQDGDGIPDYMDTDSDNDGISDFIEGNDANNDGVADQALANVDANNNGLDDNFDNDCGVNYSAGSTDFAEEASGGSVNKSSTDLEFCRDGSTQQTVGIIFSNVLLDPNETVNNAYVQFETDEVSTGTVTVNIRGQLNATPANFTTANNNVTSRTPLTASIPWSPANWNTIGERGTAQQTVDISGIINQITALGAWANGNSISLIFSGTGTNRRTAETSATLVYTKASTFCRSNGAIQDFDSDGTQDWRDIDDDADGILTVDEQTDTDGSGTVDYLEQDAGACGVGKAESYAEFQSETNDVVNELNAEGAPDGQFARIYEDNETLVLDMKQNYPAGTQYLITWRRRNNVTSGTAIIDLSESTSPGSGFTNHPTSPTNTDNVNWTTTSVTSNVSFRYLKFDKGNSSSVDYEIDAVAVCATDSDLDGVANIDDIDDDNDGVLDTAEDANTDGDNNPATNPTDSDGDGVADYLDIDSDNDGIPDIIEAGGVDANDDGKVDGFVDTDGDGYANTFDTNNGGTPLADGDFDGDGKKNRVDIDSDNDGVVDIIEAGGVDTDNNGRVDGTFSDANGNGWSSTFDPLNGGKVLDYLSSDSDGRYDWLDLDSDNDGIPDIIEAGGVDTNNDGKVDTATDTDGDGWANTFDSNNGGTALADGDKDNDGSKNRVDLDSDNDGIADIVEAGGVDADNNGIADNLTDTDGDGWMNIFDSNNGGTALPVTNTDGVGDANYLDIDSDDDGIVDVVEAQASGTGINTPFGTDTDGDGIDDSFDGAKTLSVPVDTDGDGTPDYIDTDSDNDGLSDYIEAYDTDGNDVADVTPTADTDNDGLLGGFDNIVKETHNTASSNVNNGRQTSNSFPDNDKPATAERDWREFNDADNDGVPDRLDADDDNDGILDVAEAEGANNPLGDEDGDGFPNWKDVTDNGNGGDGSTTDYTDADGNGIPDVYDSDGDGIPSHLDIDSDNDGIPDIVEAGGVDTDGNGRIDGAFVDTDGDGVHNTYDTDNGGDNITNADTDGDGLKDFLDIDADNDGIPDVVEAGGTDENGDGRIDDWADADGDGLNDVVDGDPNNDGTVDNTANALVTTGVDTDADGVPNSYAKADNDGDGIPNHKDIDADNDGISDVIEAGGTDENGDGRADDYVDADGDGFNDRVDGDPTNALAQGSDAAGANTGNALVVTGVDTDANGSPNSRPNGDADKDGVFNFLDLDSDNDGISDVVEVGGTDENGDGRADDYIDADGDGFNDRVDGDPTNALALGSDAAGANTADALVVTGADADLNGAPDDYPTDDPDNDGIMNFLDLDADNDGIADVVEAGGTDVNGDGRADDFIDNDDDGFNDVVDGDPTNALALGTDTDGANAANALIKTGADAGLDGAPDSRPEGDFDGDNVYNFLDLDSDDDGILDNIEAGGTDANRDGQEVSFVDADGDGFNDNVDGDPDNSLTVGSDATDTNLGGVLVATGDDTDATLDGRPNSYPNDDFDSDSKYNFLDIDADNDGITDNTEGQGTSTYVAPANADADGDGIDDAYDADDANFGGAGSSFVLSDIDAATDTDSPDYLDLDSDGDLVNDVIEGHDTDGNGLADSGSPANTGLSGGTTDADGDGLLDGYDNNTASNDPTNGSLQGTSHPNIANAASAERDWREIQDTDGDGVSDLVDVDNDNDGILNTEENGGNDPYGDEDGDGIYNLYDTTDDGNGGDASTTDYTDSNADGIPDVYDADGDGVPNMFDLDSDNDGVADIAEAGGVDTDGDGRIDGVFADTDGDGLHNTYDTDNGGDNISNPDTDGDGVKDYLDLDSDNDGIADVVELGGTDTNGDGRADGWVDADGDGFNDVVDGDVGNDGTAENSADALLPTGADTDGDGIPNSYPGDDFDGDGVLNHRDLDSDNDGIPDVVEAGGTDENGDGKADDFVDADGDGFNDVVDGDPTNALAAGTDTAGANTGDALVTTGADTDGDGAPNSVITDDADGDGNYNFQDLDSDNDGIPDVVEVGGTDANGDGKADDFVDADGDGFNDVVDGDPTNALANGDDSAGANTGDALVATGPDADGNGAPDSYPNGDADSDGIPNYLDLDSDNDGLADVVEAGGTDENGDGRADDFVDADGDGFNDVVDGDPTNALANGDDSAGANTGDALVVTDTDANGDGAPDSVINDDADGDGVHNFLDLDSDNDGIPDVVEAGGTDTNGDGRADGFVDADGDGFNDVVDGDPTNALAPGTDTAGANTGDALVVTGSDANGDGTPDNIVEDDADGDGVYNFYDLDSDNDGIPDVVEAGGTDVNGDGIADGFVDADGDGFNDVVDGDPTNALGAGTDTAGANTGDALVTTGADTDGDGAPNSTPNDDADQDGNYNFQDVDADNDGIPDVVEAGGTDVNGDGRADGYVDADGDGFNDVVDGDPTNALVTGDDSNGANSGDALARTGADTDGDGAPNSTPNDDADKDGVQNYLDLDSDNDGIPDVVEAGGTDANGDGRADDFVDADGDGFNDVVDGDPTGALNPGDDTSGANTGDALARTGADTDGDGAPNSTPNNDKDGDGVVNYYDLDSDNDGIPDVVEAGGTDVNGDGRADGYVDADGDGFNDVVDGDPTNALPSGDDTAGANTGDALVPTGADTNGDGAPDTTPNGDLDQDGVYNFQDLDADNDGILDNVEAGGTDANQDGIEDGFVDADGDGFNDVVDGDPDNSLPAGSDATDSNLGGVLTPTGPDANGDGTPDSYPNDNADGDNNLNFLDIDSDNDGIVDNTEGQSTAGYVAPDGNDADGDGIDDAYDANDGAFGGAGSGITPVDTDSAADPESPDYLDTDSDNDGLGDVVEGHDTNGDVQGDANSPADGGTGGTTDTDGDGLLDGFDNNNASPDPTNGGLKGTDHPGISTPSTAERDWREVPDKDGDGINDYVDIDDDNDGILDGDEIYCSTPDAYWGLNESTDDRTANGNDERADGNAPGYSTESIQGTHSASFDGTGNKIRFSQDGGFMETAATQISFSAFIKVSSVTGERIIFEEGDATDGFQLWLNAGLPTATVASGGSITSVAAESPLVVDNIWRHVAAVYDAGTLTVYVDGVGVSVTGAGASIGAHPDDGGIGGPHETPVEGAGEYFAGLMDGVQYSNTEAWIASNIGYFCDADGDGFADSKDLDSDNDGIPDIIEAGGVDTDDNGLVDGVFTDNDGDGWSDTFDPNGSGARLADGDVDGDGFPNRLDVDSDGDGIADIIEAGGVDNNNNARIDVDTDTDQNGLADAVDKSNGGTALPRADFDGDGVPNYLDLDADNDGILDNDEAQTTLAYQAPTGLDTDGDGWDNRYDQDNGGTAISLSDKEGDSNPDYLDLNTDGDAQPDHAEGFDDNNSGDALDDLLARANAYETANGNPGEYNNNVNTDGDNMPDWMEDDNSNGIPNYLDPASVHFRDADGDGLINLFDPSNGGAPSNKPDGNGNGEFDFRDLTTTTPLPIELLEFEAVKDGNRVRLNWVTATEINNDYFTIERSSNGIDFEPIILHEGAGNSQQVIEYERFDDRPMIGRNYYRIKQTDFDGQSETFETRLVVFEGEARGVSVYPNPASDEVFAEFTNFKAGQYEIIILSAQGSQVKTQTLNLEQNTSMMTIELLQGLQLARGTYYVKVVGETKTSVYPIVIEQY